jgi:cytochrome b pre-mRNA-processing protein 3
MLLRRILGFGDGANRAVTDALYAEIVAAARQPVFYSEWDVPDTPLGRFEMLALQMFVFLHRMKDTEGPARALAQDLTDEFFKDVDHSLRELGIGDMGIPKRMKRLARMFYGRANAYGTAIEAADMAALAEALARNVRPDAAAWPQSRDLAGYLADALAHLRAQPLEELLSGRMALLRVDGAGRK